MGRNVVANVEMGWFPEADTCPLVSVDPYTIDPDDERVDKWRALPHSIIYDDLPDHIVLEVRNYQKFDLIPRDHGAESGGSMMLPTLTANFPNVKRKIAILISKHFWRCLSQPCLNLPGCPLTMFTSKKYG